MSDSSTGTGTPVAPVPPTPEQDTILPPKRNHNRRPGSMGRGREPLTTEQQQQIITMAAAGHSQTKISKTIGKGRNMVKRHLDTPEAIAQVGDERTELVELYRQKARDCVAAIDDDKIAKSSALQLATSSGILLDKSLLLSGQPTSIIHVTALLAVLDLIKEQKDAREEKDEREYRQAHARLLAENKP